MRIFPAIILSTVHAHVYRMVWDGKKGGLCIALGRIKAGQRKEVPSRVCLTLVITKLEKP